MTVSSASGPSADSSKCRRQVGGDVDDLERVAADNVEIRNWSSLGFVDTGYADRWYWRSVSAFGS